MNQHRPLGRRPQRFDSRTLQFSKYLAKKKLPLPAPPSEVSWITKVPKWPMHLNDRIGDCTTAAAAHMIEQWTFYASGSEILVPDSAVLKAYMDVSGYVPDDPNNPQSNNTDNGAVMLDVLNYWRKVGIGGHKIVAYTQVDVTSEIDVQWAIQLFGNLYTGIALPLTAQIQDAWTVAEGGIYTDQGEPWSWGGHCVPTCARSPLTASVVTWGETLKMSHNFWKDYVDECYAVVSPDFLTRLGKTPGGFDVNALLKDLESVTR